MRGVEVGDPEMTDLAGAPQVGEPVYDVDTTRCLVAPPVELNRVRDVDAETAERAVDDARDRAPVESRLRSARSGTSFVWTWTVRGAEVRAEPGE